MRKYLVIILALIPIAAFAAPSHLNFETLGVRGGAAVDIPGVIIHFAGATCPTKTLEANGAAISRSVYSQLFAAIGTAHGSGDGSTTFNLPDLRGAFLRGAMASALNSISGSGSASSNNATFTAHGLVRTGMKVRLLSGSLTGLSTSTDYYAIVVDANTVAFATSRANAIAGTKVSISGTNTAVIGQWVDPDAGSRESGTVGANSGSAVGSWQDFQIQSHSHSIQTYQSEGGGAITSLGVAIPNSFQTGATGGNETRPTNVYAKVCIFF